jgi:hypothetical protein
MICSECGRTHEITGSITVDGWPLPLAAIESITEILCKHGKLGLLDPEGAPDLGPPVP